MLHQHILQAEKDRQAMINQSERAIVEARRQAEDLEKERVKTLEQQRAGDQAREDSWRKKLEEQDKVQAEHLQKLEEESQKA